MKKLFGSQGSTTVGAPQLPAHLQTLYDQATKFGQKFLDNPSEYFAPMGLTGNEQLAGNLLASPFTDPNAYRQGIESFLSPYRDILTQDINKQFEAPQSALAARASEAGAFGGTRHRGAQADLERARLDAITSGLQGQYNTAQNQFTTGLSNLLGFGGLERELDLQRRMAPVSAYETYLGGTTPFLNAQTYSPVTVSKGSKGFLGSTLGKIAFGLDPQTGIQLGAQAMGFSDSRLKRNIKRIGKMAGLPLYVFEYIWSPEKVVGFMAHEVEKLYPQAVYAENGYKKVNYGEING